MNKTELAEGLFHTPEHQSQNIKWEEEAGRGDHCSKTGWTQPVGGEELDCATIQCFFCVVFFSSSFSLQLLFLSLSLLLLYFILFQLLNYS